MPVFVTLQQHPSHEVPGPTWRVGTVDVRRTSASTLSELLMGEYASTVPPGRVLALVARTMHELRTAHVPAAERPQVAESLVRERLGRPAMDGNDAVDRAVVTSPD